MQKLTQHLFRCIGFFMLLAEGMKLVSHFLTLLRQGRPAW